MTSGGGTLVALRGGGGNRAHNHQHRHAKFLTLTLIWCLMAALSQVAHLQHQQQAIQQSLEPRKSHPRTLTSTTTNSTTNRPKSTTTTTTTSRKPKPIDRVVNDRATTPDDDQTREDEQLKSALQVRRVARNVRRKIDQMSNRVDQIQSMIAQDHDQSGRNSQNESMARESRSSDTGGGLWLSAPLDENDTGDHLPLDNNYQQQANGGESGGTGEPNERQPVNNTTATRWSSPVISSVIPGRAQETAPAPDRADSTSGATASNDSQTDSSSPASDDLESNTKGNQDEQATSGGELSQNQTQSRDQSQPSMLGPEWASSQNYNYFSELNAKNHGGGVSSGDTPTSVVSKFQNMTILNSDTDLANSYSAAGPTLVMGNMTATPLVAATTRRPLPPTDQQEQQPPTRKTSSSVHTYKAGNYGKSSRDQLHATSTTSQPSYRSMPASGSQPPSGGEPHTWAPNQPQQHGRASGGNNHRQSLGSLASEQVVRWPTLATPAPSFSYSTDLAAQANQVGLLPSMSNLPAANRYSSVMMPPSALTARQQQQHDTGDDLSAHRYSLALGPERTTSGGATNQDGNGQEHDSRRRSVEAQRQLTNSVDTTIYERRHDQQPPQEPSTIVVQPQQQQQPDYYSSRLDAGSNSMGPDTPTSNSTVDRSDHLGGSQHDHGLKHRSSGNSMMTLDEQMTGGVGGDNSVVSPVAAGSSGANGGGHTPPSVDTGTLQQPSPLDSYPGQTAADMTSGYATHNQPQLDPRAYYATFSHQNQQQVSPQESYNLNSGQQPSLASSYASITQDLQDGSLTAAQQQQLMSQLDQLSDQQQAQQSSRHYSQQQQQQSGYSPMSSYYSTQSASSLQEALQAAAANQREQQTLARQQRAESSSNPTAADYSAYLQAYQQQQRALAAQLASQQQQRMLARAYHESSGAHQQQVDSAGSNAQQSSLAAAIQGNMLKRYSPETALANYLTARSSSMSHGSGLQSAISDQPAYYYSQQQQHQPTSTSPSASQYYSTSTPGGASNAHFSAYRAAQLAALASYQRMLAEAASQQATSSSGGGVASTGISGQGSASQGGMYATSAMNQPVFYEAPQSLVSQQRGGSGGSSDSGASVSPEVASGSSSSSGSRSNASRRNYFGNLFKPSAASRYYYGPTLLSPISLGSPGLHAIYAASPSAAGSPADTATSAAASQYYALNPYMAAAALMSQQQQQQQQYAQHYRPAASAHYASYQDPTGVAAAAAQYQQALAAAAAASGFQPHYMSPPTGMMSGLGGAGGGGGGGVSSGGSVPDADMAESSLDGSSTSTSSTDGSPLGADSESSGSSSSSSGASKSSSGGMKQWLTVASLLAGILPMGLVMASMLPMLTVAGRKKRELELFGARNLSDILSSSWQGGSGMLKALMQLPPRYEFDGTARSANASTQVLNEIVARASDHSSDTQAAAKSARLLGSSAPGALRGRRLSLGLGAGASTAKPTSLSTATNNSTLAPHVTQVLAAPSIGGQQTGATTNSPGNDLLATSVANPAGPLKSTMKKVLSKVNNLIVTAQKRKHRSSPVDSPGPRWFQVPGFLGGGGGTATSPASQSWLGLKSLFDTTEMKRYLADVVRTRILAAAAAATPTISQQEAGQSQVAANLAASSRETPAETRLESTAAAANETRASESQNKTQRPSAGARDNDQQRPLVVAGTGREQTSGPTTHLVAQIQVAPLQQQQQVHANKIAGSHQQQQQQLDLPANEPMGQHKHVANNEVEPDLKKSSAEEKLRPDVEGHLLPCLYKVVCDLAGKLKRTSMKNQNDLGNEETEAALTQQIVNQLLDHIEAADRETRVFNQTLRNERSNKDSRLQLIKRGVMGNECSRLFTCPNAQQFKKVFAQLRWPTK